MGLWQEGGISKVGANIVGNSQGVDIIRQGRIIAAELSRIPGQVAVPVESRSDVSAHSFWKQGATSMFEMRISNLDAGSYMRMTPKNDLAKAEKERKGLYIQSCLDHRRSFIPMV